MKILFILPNERTSLPAVVEVLFVFVNESNIVFAADKKDWGVRAKTLDLVIPHFTAVFQRAGAANIEAHQDHVRPS